MLKRVSIVRATFIMAAAAAYFGLAVLGWGGPAAFLSHPAPIALTVALFVVAGASLVAGGNISPGVLEDRGNRWVVHDQSGRKCPSRADIRQPAPPRFAPPA